MEAPAAAVISRLRHMVIRNVPEHLELLQQLKIFGSNEYGRWLAVLGNLYAFVPITGTPTASARPSRSARIVTDDEPS